MGKPRRFLRLTALFVTGGCLLQIVGCVSGLVPVFAGYAESVALRGLLGWLIGR